MRVIIEVDSKEELAEALSVLGNRSVKVVSLSPEDRAARLQEVIQKYRINLPEDWTFDRDEAHQR